MCAYRLFLRKLARKAYLVVLVATVAASRSSAYTVVTSSTGAPAGLEQAFIQAAQAQFTSSLSTNPFVANTWTLKLYDTNPAYNPGVTQSDLLRSLVSVSTENYVYGFADGMDYQNNRGINDVAILDNLCGSATNFILVQTTTATFNAKTCNDVLGTVLEDFFQMDLSTPTVIPNGH